MERKIFREKSLERVTSPEQLDDYLHVITPAVWAVLLGVVIMLGSFFFWCTFTAVDSYVYGAAESKNGVMTITFPESEIKENLEEGMVVSVGSLETRIESLGQDEEGREIAIAELDLPDGRYDVKVCCNSTQIIRFLLN